jgi:hypothetical protein
MLIDTFHDVRAAGVPHLYFNAAKGCPTVQHRLQLQLHTALINSLTVTGTCACRLQYAVCFSSSSCLVLNWLAES